MSAEPANFHQRQPMRELISGMPEFAPKHQLQGPDSARLCFGGRERSLGSSISLQGESMTVPVCSGKNWQILADNEPVIDHGRSKTIWLQNADDPNDLGLFKSRDENAPSTEVYSLGMERVAYALGDALGFPVAPGVHLEEFDGEPGVISCQIANSVSWREFESRKLSHEGIVNLAAVPEYIAFDIWLANIDRSPRNILLQSVPPVVDVAKADRFSFHLIDHGFSGLWPVAKLGSDPNEPVSFVNLGDGTTVREDLVREVMPPAYWHLFASMNDSDRVVILDGIRSVNDDLIDAAIDDVPDAYMTERERSLTAEFLKKRRDNVDALSHALL